MTKKDQASGSGAMPAAPSALGAVSGLMEERRRFESWLSALEARRDTTPPRVENLAASIANPSEAGGELHVTFRATDSFSPIKHAEYSLDASDWQFIEPVGKLSDAKSEDYDFRISIPIVERTAASGKASKKNAAASTGPIEHVVVVRVYDRYDNMGTAKFVVRGR